MLGRSPVVCSIEHKGSIVYTLHKSSVQASSLWMKYENKRKEEETKHNAAHDEGGEDVRRGNSER